MALKWLANDDITAAETGCHPHTSADARPICIHPSAAPHCMKRRLGQDAARVERGVPMRIDVGDLIL